MSFDLDDEEYEATRKMFNKDEIQIGEYIRTKNGEIDKIEEIFLDDINEEYIETEYFTTSKDQIAKHSKNIIDLIEVGDYVNGELIREPIYNGNTWYGVDEGYELFKRAFGEIKSIVTKEQFKSVEYKIGD